LQLSRTLINSVEFSREGNTRRGRDRPKPTWDESIKRDLKEWNIPKELALDRSAWKIGF
jgi:hypothetical protein